MWENFPQEVGVLGSSNLIARGSDNWMQQHMKALLGDIGHTQLH